MQLGEITEQYIPSGTKDNKGRFIGYIVGFRDDGANFYAWVQNTRRINGEWKEFGVRQRSKQFTSQAAATSWAFATVKTRIDKLGA